MSDRWSTEAAGRQETERERVEIQSSFTSGGCEEKLVCCCLCVGEGWKASAESAGVVME